MSFYDLDYLIISSNDEFMNSMTDNESKRINKICGFTGSNGVLVLSKNEMHLFTDSRYLIQAKKQTECTIINIGECSLIKFFQTLDNNERVNIGLFSYLHPRSEIINFVNAVKSTSRYVFFLNHDDFDEKIYLKKEIRDFLWKFIK